MASTVASNSEDTEGQQRQEQEGASNESSGLKCHFASGHGVGIASALGLSCGDLWVDICCGLARYVAGIGRSLSVRREVSIA